MKKICFITTIPATLKAFVLPLAKYFHENSDFEISFICDADDVFKESLPPYINYFPVKMSRGISFSGFSALFKIIKIFKKEKFDIIQYSTPNAACYAAIAGKIAKVPVRLYAQWGLVFEAFKGFKKRLFLLLEKIICLLSTSVQPDSRGNLNYCRSLGLYNEEKSSIILNGSACGVNLEKFDITKKEEYRKRIRKQYNIPADAFVYGFVGSIEMEKGINELMAASKKIISDNLNVYVIIIGLPEKEYTINQELYNWAKEAKQFIFCGRTEVVEQYMSAMDCYVIPSYREGFGMTVVEAGAMGLPAIISNIPGPTDAIKDSFNGLVVEKKNVQQLENAMLKVLSDTSFVKQLGLNAYNEVKEKFDQKVLFKAILENRIKLLENNQNQL